MRLIYLLIFCVLTGCHAAPPNVATTQPTILLWSAKSIDRDSANAWAKEAEKRLHTSDFVLLAVHGGAATVTDRTGQKHQEWFVWPDPPRKAMRVDDVAWVVRNIWWDRPLVIVSCNAGGFELTAPRTLYGKRVVWTNPDAATPLYQFRRQDWIGDISQFTSTEKVRLAGER